MIERCAYTQGEAQCVFGLRHGVNYHHLSNGQNVPVKASAVDDVLANRLESVADELFGFEDGLAEQVQRQAQKLRGEV